VLRRNVLIFHQGALGDFVLTWPLAMALSRVFPQSRVIYVTASQKGALAERVLRVDSVDVEGGWHQLFGEAPKLPEPATKLLAGAHSVFTFVAGAASIWAKNVIALEPQARVVRLEPRPPSDYRGHFTDFLVEQLGNWPAVQAATGAMLRTVHARGISTSSPRGDHIVIHPGSGGAHKCWPRERFVQLIRRLRDEGRRVRVVLGEAELERWSADEVAQLESLTEVVRPMTLVELFEHVSTAAAAVMNDSGPAHLAAATGTPTVCLFGPSNPTIWRPVGPKVTLIQHDSLDAIEAGAVYDKLSEFTRG
jgi:ADP-heptose:LPS heptosyltransferase